jgi:hypothetical protein
VRGKSGRNKKNTDGYFNGAVILAAMARLFAAHDQDAWRRARALLSFPKIIYSVAQNGCTIPEAASGLERDVPFSARPAPFILRE